jgi:hypothetical protein
VRPPISKRKKEKNIDFGTLTSQQITGTQCGKEKKNISYNPTTKRKPGLIFWCVSLCSIPCVDDVHITCIFHFA